MNNKIRFGGVLLHPTSLPAKHGIGDLGSTAIHFIDFLERSRFGLWQILPLGPVGFGNSPYASRSSFAGNELLIDLDDLAAEGYLDLADVLEHPEFSQDRVDFTEVSDYKKPLLHKAARFFIEQEQSNEKQQAYRTFCSHQKSWLDDYALYAALCDYYQDSRWFKTWDPLLTKRDGKALKDWSKRLSIEIEEYKVLQYFFDIQWNALHAYATERHISIIGDIPIFVAHDSVDAWCNRTYLKMDDQGNALAISGVPPDAYSATGQLWGNPVYDWQALEKDGFSWWVKRIRRALELTDIVRIDHFRGFEAYWEVPAGQKTAEYGSWVAAPGQKLFDVLRQELGTLPVFAEDLGVITEQVEQLRDVNGFPGMKVAQFGFSVGEDGFLDAGSVYLPHHYQYQETAYTGTHDNDTTRGWYASLDEQTKDMVRRYLACSDDAVVWHMVRAVLASHAKYAVIPMQDLLNLGSEARMNLPGTCGDHNWSWRVKKDLLSDSLADANAVMLRLFARASV